MSQVTLWKAETFSRIIRTIESTTALDLLHDKWSALARALDMPSGRITKIRVDLQLDKIFLGDALNQILEEWQGKCGSDATLDNLIRAFEGLDLNSIGEALRLEFNLPCKRSADPAISWNDIGNEFKKKVANNLEEFYPSITFDDESKSKLTKEELVALMTGKKPSLFNSTIPLALKYYVPRTLITRNVLKDELFQRSSDSDTFMFTGIERHYLSSKAGGQLTDTTTNQLDYRDPTVKFMVLDMPNHFAKIYSLSRSPVHLIKFEDDKSCWVKSIGSLDNIRRFIDKDQRHLSESEFFKMIDSSSVSNLPVCISDSPGMGKSEILKQMARNIATLLPERIIIFQEITKFIDIVKQIHKVSSDGDLQFSVRTALEQLACKNELGSRLLNSKLESEATTIELLLDGYDELNRALINTANEILKEINSSLKSIRLWVTTRPHLLPDLENMLTVLGHTIQSFTFNDQINFLTSYWSKELTLTIDIYRLTEYAANCLKYLKSALSTQEEDIAGIPLQCLMIGEVYEEEAIDYAQSDADFTGIKIRVTSITDLYELTIEKKLKKYQCSSTYSMDKLNDNELINMHFQLGLKLTFPEYFEKVKSTFKNISKGDVLNVGILESKGSEGELTFIHRTFAEYFVALFVVNMLCGKYIQNEPDDGNENQADLPPKEVLDFYQPPRPTSHPSVVLHGLQERVLKFPVICFFTNSLLREGEVQKNIAQSYVELFSKNTSYHRTATLEELAGACIDGNFINLFNLFERFNAFEGEYFFTERLALRSIEKSRVELIRKTFAGLERFHEIDINFQTKALQCAVKRGEFTPFEFLLNEKKFRTFIEDGDNYTKMQLLHCCVENSKDNSDEIIRQKIEVIQFLVKKNHLLLEEKNHNGCTPLVCDNVHAHLLIKLIELGSNVLATSHSIKTVLHFTHFTPVDYQCLLTNVKMEYLVRLVKVSDNSKESPLISLVRALDPEEATLDIFKDAGADFNIYGTFSTIPLLAIAIKNGRNMKTLRKLIHCGVDVNWSSERKQTLLHIAAASGNLDAVSVLSEYNVDINGVDLYRNTPLLHMVSYENYRKDTGKKPASGPEVIRKIIECGGNATMQDYGGNTFLHNLLSPNNISSDEFHNVIVVLLQLKCSHVLEIDNNIGSSCLMVAMENIDVEVETLSLVYNQGVNLLKTTTAGTRQSNGITTFDYIREHVKEWALENRHHAHGELDHVDQTWVNLRSGPGTLRTAVELMAIADRTLLHGACLNANYKVIPFLLGIGLNVNKKDAVSMTPLHYAATITSNYDINYRNRWETMKVLIENGADVYATKDGDTFLHCLLARDNFVHGTSRDFHVIAECLVKNGHAKVFNIERENGVTPLHLAVGRCCVEDATISLLNTSGIEFNCVDNSGDSLLAHAIRGSNSENLLRILINYGANVKHTNNMEQNLLHIAATNGRHGVIEFIINLDVNVDGTDKNGDTPLHLCFKIRSWFSPARTDDQILLKTINLLVGKGARVTLRNKSGLSPFSLAKKRFPRNTQLLHMLSNRITEEINNQDENGNSVLHMAVFSKDFVLVGELVKQGVDVNGQNNKLETSLHVASCTAEKGDALKIIYLLIDNNADPNIKDENDQTFLHILLANCTSLTSDQFHDFFCYLIGKGHSKSLETGGLNNGITPIHVWLFNHVIETRTVAFLSSHVNWNLADHHGRTPLNFAICAMCSSPLLRQIVELGADYRIHDNLAYTLLHVAAAVGNIDALEYLIRLRLDINATNSSGNTPLHLALIQGEENIMEVVGILEKAGADANLRNNEGKTPFSLLLAKINSTPNQIDPSTNAN